MNTISFDCVGKIAIHLSLYDLVNLQRASKYWWKALNSQKLGYVWHGKYIKYYNNLWNKNIRKEYYDNSEKITVKNIFNPYLINIRCYVCDPTKSDPRKEKYVANLKERLVVLEQQYQSINKNNTYEELEILRKICEIKNKIENPCKADYIPDINTDTWGCTCRSLYQ